MGTSKKRWKFGMLDERRVPQSSIFQAASAFRVGIELCLEAINRHKHSSFFPHSLSYLIARVAEAAKAFCTWDLQSLCYSWLLSSVLAANHSSRL